MKPETFLMDLNQFKDEILKKVRLLENRLTNDINNKYNQTNLIYESINNRINIINHNNASFLEFMSSQKSNLNKINTFEKFNDKIENRTVNNEIIMKHLETKIDDLNEKFKKLIEENLIVSGCIGP